MMAVTQSKSLIFHETDRSAYGYQDKWVMWSTEERVGGFNIKILPPKGTKVKANPTLKEELSTT